MKMTLFVDASHCPTTKAGGLGAWCKKDGWDRGYAFGGTLERICRNSTEAELLAIAQAVEFLQNHGEFDHVTYLMIQSDCLHALHGIVKYGSFDVASLKNERDASVREGVQQASPKYQDLAVRIDAATRKAQLRVVRHVKGHQEGRSSRSWVNEQCDALAKQHMRAARAEAYGRAGLANKRLRERDQSGRVGDQT